MEHLTCLTPSDLTTFIDITEMKVIAATPESIIIHGEFLFTYVYDYAKQMFCFTKGTLS